MWWCIHRELPSRESTKLVGFCDACTQSRLAYISLATDKATGHSMHALSSPSYTRQHCLDRRTRKHTHTRLPCLEPTHSGQTTHQAPHMLTPTTTRLPKPSSIQSTQRPLFQHWQTQLSHLTYRKKHRKSNTMGRQKNMPK